MVDSHVNGDFLSNAILDTVVPQASSADIEEALSASSQVEDEGTTSLLPSIAERELLFFGKASSKPSAKYIVLLIARNTDELLTVYVVLRLSNCSEASLKSHLPRLKVRLEAFATNNLAPESQDEGSGQARDLIFSGDVMDTEDPLIIVHDSEGEQEDKNHILVIWKIEVFLNRPRIRLQTPSVVFNASATLTPSHDSNSRSINDEYLPSLIPASVNLLEPLKADPALKDTNPYLPASRLLRVLPASPIEAPSHHIRSQTQRAIRVIVAAGAKVRYSRLNTYNAKHTTIASLDFEVTPFSPYTVVLEHTELALSSGRAELLTSTPNFTPPITCRPRDDITFLFKLIPDDRDEYETTTSTTAVVSVLDISIRANVQVSDDCTPRISMRWRTNVDFSTALNPTFGGPSQVLQRNNRPASIPVTSTASNGANNAAPSASIAIAPTSTHPTPMPRDRTSSLSNLGVTISFSGPSQVSMGQSFRWDVFIVNHSSKPRKLVILAIPRRRRANPAAKTVLRNSTASSTAMGIPGKGENNIAEAVADENIVYAMQKASAVGEGTELVCLSGDVRVGPLLPGSCHATELKFLPLASGPLHLEVVRIIDVNTNEATDIRDLPDIVAVDGQEDA